MKIFVFDYNARFDLFILQRRLRDAEQILNKYLASASFVHTRARKIDIYLLTKVL